MVRAEDSGVYYARVKVRGKLYWRSLDTDTFTTAKTRLPDKLKELRKLGGVPAPVTISNKTTFAEAVEIYREQIDGNADLKPRSKVFRMRSELTLKRTYPEIFDDELRRITAEKLKAYINRLKSGDCRYLPPNAKDKAKARAGNSATTVNAMVGFLRHVCDVGVSSGICAHNPAANLSRKTPRTKLLRLPNKSQFAELVRYIRALPGWGQKAADLTEGLAYTGLRIGESRMLKWGHLDFERGLIHVSGEKTEAATRTLPMIPAARELFNRMRAERKSKPDDSVFEVGEATESLASASAAAKIAKLTHHDLRHLFATTCIESGVDVPTVSKWLGHVDGGALAMRTYGHLRPAHSVEAASKVSFH